MLVNGLVSRRTIDVPPKSCQDRLAEVGAMHNGKEFLRRRLQDAKLQLTQAHSLVQDIEDETGTIPPPDGNFAYREALQAESLALKKYREAIHAYYEVVLTPKELATDTEDESPAITPREREVLMLIASGKSSREIAAELGIAFRTVVAHRYHLQTKLKAHKTADLTRLALRMGLIEL